MPLSFLKKKKKTLELIQTRCYEIPKVVLKLFLYSEQPETSTHTYLSQKNKQTQEQTKHINVQIIQLHQACSRRRKEKADPSVKPSFETS